MTHRAAALAAVAAGACAVALLASGDTASSRDLFYPHRPASIWAVGDGADGSAAAIQVAEMIEYAQPDRFVYLGDVYESGTADEYAEHYAPVYGRFDPIAAPTPGNHEWGNRAEGYYPYWERAWGSPVPDYYSFRIAGWQLLSLNSETDHDSDSAQLRWLRDRLRNTPGVGTCRIAFWHRPRYSAGVNGDNEDVWPFWDLLARRATIVLNGHDHEMQRHRRRDGLVAFISGAGGHSPTDVDEADPRLAFAADGVDGALRLVLRRRTARFAFVSASGELLDAGRLPCRRGREHSPPINTR